MSARSCSPRIGQLHYTTCADATPGSQLTSADQGSNLSSDDAGDIGQTGILLAQELPSSGAQASTPEQPPAGTAPSGARKITGSIFERRIRNVHLFLGLEGHYTDNVYNTREDRKPDYKTVVSPGISFSIPAVKDNWKATNIETSNIAPGGSAMTRFITRYPGRLQASLLYRADLERYSRQTAENTTRHLVEGAFQYNFRGGLSLDVQDQFMRGRNLPGSGLFFQLDRFNSNFFSTMASYEMSDRVLLRLDYSNFAVRYLDSRNDFRDRMDNSLSGYFFYKITPRTALFAQYEFLDVTYDEAVLPDSRLHNIYAGVRWDITAKTKGSVKLGYGLRDSASETVSNREDLLGEAQLTYYLTPKTSVSLAASRKENETDISTTNSIISDSLRATYTQRFTSKINGSVFLGYQRDRYNGDLSLGGETKKLVDRYYDGGVAIQYEMKDWLKFDVGYRRSQRSSSFRDFDYTNNTFYFKIASFI